VTGFDTCDDLFFGHDQLYMGCIFYLYVGMFIFLLSMSFKRSQILDIWGNLQLTLKKIKFAKYLENLESDIFVIKKCRIPIC